MGFLRLYLALCVIQAHSEAIFPWRNHGGREAVQIFYIISGFYMQYIWAKSKYVSAKSFYQSRALRIFVPYWTILAIVVLVSLGMGFFLDRWLTLSQLIEGNEVTKLGPSIAILSNFTIFFQDMVFFLNQDPGTSLHFTSDFWKSSQPLFRFLWIPQAWSVGVELTFYLIAPLLCRNLKWHSLIGILVASIAFRFLAYGLLDLDHDPWTYRFFPFELTYFLLGILACRILLRNETSFAKLESLVSKIHVRFGLWFYPFLFLMIGLCLWIHARQGALVAIYAKRIPGGLGSEIGYMSVMVSWIVILPFLFTISQRLKFDRWIGELSYPVYLLHFTVAMMAKSLAETHPIFAPFVGEFSAILSIAVAIALNILVFQRFENWRQDRVLNTLRGCYISDDKRVPSS